MQAPEQTCDSSGPVWLPCSLFSSSYWTSTCPTEPFSALPHRECNGEKPGCCSRGFFFRCHHSECGDVKTSGECGKCLLAGPQASRSSRPSEVPCLHRFSSFSFFLSKHRSRVKWCPPSDGLHKVKIHTEAAWPGLLEDFHFSLLLIQFHTFSIDFALMHFHKYFHISKSSQMLYFMLT